MTADAIKHFLVVYNRTAGRTKVREFGADYDAAQRAYEAAERDTWSHPDVDVVLLSADSLATVKHTHSSWFGVRNGAGLLAAAATGDQSRRDHARGGRAHRSHRAPVASDH